ncbi:MAG: bifunctional oligoribonuclease/PAP phosphatase NrnA [Ignavibacteriae bacterium]|nr:bifunctional oligoribonuclease/PAP phosphatase NrnA [Ignavibacteriota bacterium]
MQAQFNQFRDIIKNAKRFVLTTHVNPDGDGLGCEIALAEYLTSQGKHTHILNHSATPYYYRFLDPRGDIQQFSPVQHTPMIEQAEAIVVLDTNSPDRLASLKEHVLKSPATKVCIDHHLDKIEFADLYILDEPSAATGEILYRLLVHLQGDKFTKTTATALYTAIMTDTGSFRFPKTDPDIHRQAAQLIECGADPVSIFQQVYEQGSAGRIALLGKTLSTLVLSHEGKFASLYITKAMFNETQTTGVDADNIVNYTLAISGVQIGVLLSELEDGVKINFRSKGDIAVNKLAKEFGGNGHKNAAGARVVNGNLQQLLQQVTEQSSSYLI